MPGSRDRVPFGRWVLLGLAGAGPGLALWAITRPDPAAYLLENRLDGAPTPAILWALASTAALAAVLLWLRVFRDRDTFARACAGLTPLALAPLVALMYAPGVEARWPRLIPPLIAAVALAAGYGAYHLVGRAPSAGPRRRERAPPWLLAAGVVIVAGVLVHLALHRHWNLDSRIFDLGIFDNLVYHAAHGGWQTTTVLRGETFTSAHFSPILQLLAPLYAALPRAETLIVLQALWVTSGALPIYLLAQEVFETCPHGRWLAFALALAYLCHPSMHGVACFDFHALTLAAPLVLWSLYFVERGAYLGHALATALLLMTREDAAFLVMGVGLHAIFGAGDDARRRRAGLATLASGVLGLALIKFFFMGDSGLFMANSDATYGYANRFSRVIPDPETGGARDIVRTVLTNPGFVVGHALTIDKLTYLVALTIPCLGLCFIQRRAWWPMAFGLAFVALGSGTNLRNPYLHYTVHLFPAVIFAAVAGVAVLMGAGARGGLDTRRLAGALTVAVVVAAGLSGERLGALGTSERYRAGTTGIIRTLSPDARARLAWIEEVRRELIRPDESVSATNFIGAHFSSRARIYHFRTRNDADVLVLRDRELHAVDRRLMRRREHRGEYVKIASWRDEIDVWRRAAGVSP